MGKFNASVVKANQDFKKLGADLQRNSDKIAREVGAPMERFGRTLALAVAAPIAALGVASVQAATRMDSLRRGLTAITGSSEKAEAQIRRLKEAAKLPGLGFEEAIRGSTALQAAGLSASMAERALKGFGNALATVGKGKAELDGVILALSQIQSKGKVLAEEINQVAERVPQVRVMMLKAFGTADTEILQKMKLTTDEFFEGIVKQTEEAKKVAGGAKNSFDNFSDAANEALAEIGKSMLKYVTPAFDWLTGKLNSATKWWGNLSDAAKNAILGGGGLVAALSVATLAVGLLITKIAEAKAALISLGLLGAAGGIGGGAAAAGGTRTLAGLTSRTVGGVAEGAIAGAAGNMALQGGLKAFLSKLPLIGLGLQVSTGMKEQTQATMDRILGKRKTGGGAGVSDEEYNRQFAAAAADQYKRTGIAGSILGPPSPSAKQLDFQKRLAAALAGSGRKKKGRKGSGSGINLDNWQAVSGVGADPLDQLSLTMGGDIRQYVAEAQKAHAERLQEYVELEQLMATANRTVQEATNSTIGPSFQGLNEFNAEQQARISEDIADGKRMVDGFRKNAQELNKVLQGEFQEFLNTEAHQMDEMERMRGVLAGWEREGVEFNAEYVAGVKADDLTAAQNKVRESFGGMLASDLADEFANSFSQGLERAFGKNPFGRALARTLSRWMDGVMDQLLGGLFKGFGGSGSTGGGITGGGFGDIFGKGGKFNAGNFGASLGIGTALAGLQKKKYAPLLLSALGFGVGTIFGGAAGGIGAGIGGLLGSFLNFDRGGWVPGPVGKPQMAVVHGGEYVQTRGEATGGGGITINLGGVSVRNDMDVRRVSREIAWHVQRTQMSRVGA